MKCEKKNDFFISRCDSRLSLSGKRFLECRSNSEDSVTVSLKYLGLRFNHVAGQLTVARESCSFVHGMVSQFTNGIWLGTSSVQERSDSPGFTLSQLVSVHLKVVEFTFLGDCYLWPKDRPVWEAHSTNRDGYPRDVCRNRRYILVIIL